MTSDPHLPVCEIGWAWAKAAKEPSSDKFLDTLIGVLSDSDLGDAVFAVRNGEFYQWTRQAIRDIARKRDFQGNPVFRAAYLDDWRLRRSDFAQWYRGSHLCAGTPLDSFWPSPEGAASDTKKGDRERRSPQQVKREAARGALASLYPNGIPDPPTLANKALCGAVAAQLSFPISNDTILRAAGRKK